MDWRALTATRFRTSAKQSGCDLMSLTDSFSGVPMGSFQQIIMGVGCLIAAFWFGSILQDRPAGQNQTADLLPDGTIDPNRADPSPNLIAKTKGFLSSMFESPAKEKPITVADLRQHSKAATPHLPQLVDHTNQSHNLPAGNSHNLVVSNDIAQQDFLKLESVTSDSQPQRLVGSFQSGAPAANSTKVAIVPDFSSLAEEVNRGLSFNNRATNAAGIQPPRRSALSESSVELIPVPKFSDVGIRKSETTESILDPNWETVRTQVAAAQSRLESYRDQMTQPIPDIVDSVNQSTREFWDRQQSETRRQPVQPSRLAASVPTNLSQQRRLKPETFSEKQKRWDVFSSNFNDRKSETQVRKQSAAPLAERPAYTSMPQSRPTQSRPTQSRPRQSIVEVDRPFVSQQQQPEANWSARVRSLNDDRAVSSPYVLPQSNQYAYHTSQNSQPTERQNQLRPQFNPNAGSKPEFVSPPEYGQFSPQADSAPSEIVEAAKVTYGSFREYETQPQDTLQTISQKFYGSADYYFDLYLANRDLLSNPATVPVGMTIKIPKFDAR